MAATEVTGMLLAPMATALLAAKVWVWVPEVTMTEPPLAIALVVPTTFREVVFGLVVRAVVRVVSSPAQADTAPVEEMTPVVTGAGVRMAVAVDEVRVVADPPPRVMVRVLEVKLAVPVVYLPVPLSGVGMVIMATPKPSLVFPQPECVSPTRMTVLVVPTG